MLSILFSQAARSQNDSCYRQELIKYFSTIQLLEENIKSLPANFIRCSDSQLKEQVLFWEGFYKDFRQQKDTQAVFFKAPELFPASQLSSARERIIHAARIGQPDELKQRLDEGQLEFTEDHRNLLTLGRSLARLKRFRDALSYYDSYLKIRPQDEVADAEYLYVMIWSRDAASSRARSARLKGHELSPYLTQLVERADKVIALLDSKPETASQQQVYLEGTFAANYESFRQQDNSNRQSFRFSYQNKFYGLLGIHDLSSSLEQSSNRASEFVIGRIFELGQYLDFKTELGYFSPGHDNFTGHLAASIGPESWNLSFGARRTPLTLRRMVPKDGQELMTNELYASLQIHPFLQAFAALAQDGDLSLYEQYRLTFKLPAFARQDIAEKLLVTIPMEYEAHPKPSPYYITAPRIFALGVGLQYQRDIADEYAFKAESKYLLQNRNSRLNRNSYQRLGVYSFKADMLYKLRNNFKLSLGIDFRERAREQFERTDERYLSVQGGLLYTAKP